MRLAYPGIPVAGEYFFDDGTPAPRDNLKLMNGRWQRDDTQAAPVLDGGEISQTIVLAWGAGAGADMILQKLPDFLCSELDDANQYAPRKRILDVSPSPRVVDR
jgi:hypothetical protein